MNKCHRTLDMDPHFKREFQFQWNECNNSSMIDPTKNSIVI